MTKKHNPKTSVQTHVRSPVAVDFFGITITATPLPSQISRIYMCRHIKSSSSSVHQVLKRVQRGGWNFFEHNTTRLYLCQEALMGGYLKKCFLNKSITLMWRTDLSENTRIKGLLKGIDSVHTTRSWCRRATAGGCGKDGFFYFFYFSTTEEHRTEKDNILLWLFLY